MKSKSLGLELGLDVIHNGWYSPHGTCSTCGHVGRCHTTTTYSLCMKCYINVFTSNWNNILKGPLEQCKCTGCRVIHQCNLDRETGIALCKSCQLKFNNDNGVFQIWLDKCAGAMERMRSNIY